MLNSQISYIQCFAFAHSVSVRWSQRALPHLPMCISFSVCADKRSLFPPSPLLNLKNLKHSPFGKLSMGPLSKTSHSTVSEGGLKVYILTLKHEMFNNADLHKCTSVLHPSHEVLPFPRRVRGMQAHSRTGQFGSMIETSVLKNHSTCIFNIWHNLFL